MTNEIIKGRVEATAADRVKWGYAYYKKLLIFQPDGATRVLTKVSAAGPVRALIERGGEGEFHISKHAGMLGIHGVRMADGTKSYAHFNNMELIFALGGIIAIIGMVLRSGGIAPTFPLTPIVIGSLLGICYFVIRAGRNASRRAFEAA